MRKFIGKMQKRMADGKRKGFTLVELIVVLVILAILAAMLVPALTGYITKAREKTTLAEARNVLTAVQTYESEQYGIGSYAEKNDATPALSGTTILGGYLLEGDVSSGATAKYSTDEYAKVTEFEYTVGSTTVTYSNGEWTQ